MVYLLLPTLAAAYVRNDSMVYINTQEEHHVQASTDESYSVQSHNYSESNNQYSNTNSNNLNFNNIPQQSQQYQQSFHQQTALSEFSDNNSNISGIVTLHEDTNNKPTIKVVAFGLQPGHRYVSLYSPNGDCSQGQSSQGDIIGGAYTASVAGVGQTESQINGTIDAVHSVSIRDADSFNLLACASINTPTINSSSSD